MNSTELSVDFKDAIVNFHHIAGAIFFFVNSLVYVLILNDSKGSDYRFYVFGLQLFSMILDATIDAYTPIMLFNCRSVFSESYLATHIDIGTSFIFEAFFFCESVTAYFYCVFYRRAVVLPPGSRFYFNGSRRLILFLLLQFYLLFVCVDVIFFWNVVRASDQEVPHMMSWLRSTPSYMFVRESMITYVTASFAFLWGFSVYCVTVVMIVDVQRELKHGMHHASTATRRYQERAVSALTLQGAIPSIFYLVPIVGEGVVYMVVLPQGLEVAAVNQTASKISVLLFCAVPMHTFAHSLTLIACSPGYRRRLADVLLLLPRRLLRSEAPSKTPTSIAIVERVTRKPRVK